AISTAIWSDFDNDGDKDLIVAGEWMPITFFSNKNGSLALYRQLDHSNGWWNSLTACDFDMDGDMDYVAGNFGLNSAYRANEKEPVELYLADFDKNGSADPVMTQYYGGVKYVVPLRDVISDQMPAFKKRFADYISYAKADFSNTFIASEIREAKKFHAENLATCLIENLGKGNFSIKPLPVAAQVSSVYGVSTGDMNGDGNPDILLTGNCFAMEPQAGWNDASVGTVLLGDGKNNFSALKPSLAGVRLDNDAKALSEISTGNDASFFLISNNNGPVTAIRKNKNTEKIMKILPDDAYAKMVMQNGKIRRVEFSYGSGYLSQSSRIFKIGPYVKSAEIVKFSGEKRFVKL
nr:VCBS repeat-containing protein [Chitinophagaceae bacterium]